MGEVYCARGISEEVGELQERVRSRDGDAGLAGVALCLGGSLGCAGSGWRKEEEKKKKFTREVFLFSLSLPCPVITHTYTEAFVNSHVGSEKQTEI